jgi:hypothetical protein
MLLCVYENRSVNEPAIRLLVASLYAHMPKARLRLRFNPKSDDFAQWIAAYPGVDFAPALLPASAGWNVKPTVLLEALEQGESRVVWLDADILIAGDPSALLDAASPELLTVTEEALWGRPSDVDAMRTRAWRLPVGRTLPFTLNSAVLSVTPHHIPLLRRWIELLETPDYRIAQATDWRSRPQHLMGDQDVLTALLGSVDYGDIPLRILRRGVDILQLFGPLGFTLAERRRVCREGLPPFLHAQGQRPWIDAPPPAGLLDRLTQAYYDVSPYLLLAKTHGVTGDDRDWTRARTMLGRFLRLIGRGSIPLTGAPLAVPFEGLRLAIAAKRRLIAKLRGR